MRLALLGLLLLLLPLVALGPRAFILIHDNLEAEVVWLTVLARQRLALAGPGTAVLPIMNGLPREALRSGLSITMLVFSALPDSPLAAYLLHEALVRLAGLLGMYWLLRRYGLAQDGQRGLAAGVALLWAALPAYSVFGLSVLGQPLLLRAALDLRAGRGLKTAWAVCAGLPLWSSFVLVGPFVAVVWGGALLLDCGRLGRAAWLAVARGALGLILLLAGYVLVEWQLFYGLLIHKAFVAHREAFDLALLLPPGGVGAGLREAGRLFWLGHYHASPFFKGGILLAVALGLWRLAPLARRRVAGQVAALLALAATLSLLAGLAPLLSARLLAGLPLLHAFTLARFYFLLALPWILMLVAVLRALSESSSQKPATKNQQPATPRLAYALLALQIPLVLAANPEFTNNLRTLLGRPQPDAPGYAAYVAPGPLGQVRTFIEARTGQPPAAYRVACLGLSPGVAQLNGFYTLDSYQTVYPLAYKQAFRPIIAGELAKSPALATYFDAWGNRCYLFSAELGRDFLPGATTPPLIQHFAFDAAAFRALGGRYVLSVARLARPAEAGLRPLGVFTDSGAYWRVIYLYEAVEG